MPVTVAKAVPDPPRKMVAAQGESHRKPLAEQIGQAIERAIVLANMTKQDVAFRMGYQDQSALSRWISGVETPQFAKLFVIVELRWWLVVALADLADADTETTIRRKA